jgi:hypothetical protein
MVYIIYLHLLQGLHLPGHLPGRLPVADPAEPCLIWLQMQLLKLELNRVEGWPISKLYLKDKEQQKAAWLKDLKKWRLWMITIVKEMLVGLLVEEYPQGLEIDWWLASTLNCQPIHPGGRLQLVQSLHRTVLILLVLGRRVITKVNEVLLHLILICFGLTQALLLQEWLVLEMLL